MGRDEKEDTGYGFKDKARAEETLRLLEEQDLNYRKMTVRGLLGRARRVLSVTKAEDKKRNIQQAIEVFENWMAEHDVNYKKKKEADSDEDSDAPMDAKPKEEVKKVTPPPADKVQGLGFKDKDAAHGTLQELNGRDPEYQSLAVKGLLKSAKRVLTCTRDPTKLSNIKEAMSVLENFLDEFESKHLMRQNNPYLSLGITRTALKLAKNTATDQQQSFIAAYASVNGEYKRLRTVPEKEGAKTWDIVRNAALEGLKLKHANAKLFNENDEPTKEHLEMLLWAYSPEPSKVKKVIKETKEDEEEKIESRKRKSSSSDHESSSKKQKEN